MYCSVFIESWRRRRKRRVAKAQRRFKAHQYTDWYYVDMRTAEGAQYLALLPQPLPETRQLDYYVHALDIGVRSSQTETYAPAVITPGPCEDRVVPPWTWPEEIIIGGTKKDQRPIPPGFSSKGIIAFVAVTGAMITGAALIGGSGGAATTGATAGVGTAASGGFSSTALLVAGGFVAAGGAAAIVATSKSPDPLDVDDDGDGFSENQGDCNDQNSDLHPNGAVTATVTDSRAGRTVNCSEPWTRIYRLTNNSCQTVTVNKIVLQIESPRSPTGHRLWEGLREFNASVMTVAPGTTSVIGQVGAEYSICCAGPEFACATPVECFYIEIVHTTVSTNVGDIDAGTFQYTINATICPFCY
jgi:hypothetical protein